MRQKLNTYLPFTLNRIKKALAYKASFYLFILCSILGAFVSYYLWMAIYGSSSSGVLGGLTQNEMVTYIFMSYVTSTIAMVGISEEIGDDVEQGTVAMYMIKPINYRMSLIAQAAGDVIYRIFAPAIFVWIGLEIYRVSVLGMKLTSLWQLAAYAISVIMSFLIYVLFDFCFGMIAFITTYIFGVNLAKDALLSFLSGQLIPISFFPEAMQTVFSFLPFSSMVYTPVMIYLGKYQGIQLFEMLLRQFIWVVLLYALGSLMWKKITKRLVVLGG